MSGERPLQSSVVRLIDQAVTKNASVTSEWWDTSGWIDSKVVIDMDSAGAADVTYVIQISPQHYYELNAAASVTTDDYEQVTLSANNTTKTLQNISSADVADLKEPGRSVRIKATENDAAAVTSLKVWLIGWS